MIDVREMFDGLLDNLKVNNRKEIDSRRDEITKSLNKEFRSLDSSTNNQMMIGSYGRGTAIRGISDLDMVYLLPASIHDDYKSETGPRNILTRTRQAVLSRYPNTNIKVDQCVVAIQFQNFRFEVQPVFDNDDGSFSYPDTYAKSWKITKPREEISTIRDQDDSTNGNLRNLCKLARAWKNENGVDMGGLLIDTLTSNYFSGTTDYDEVTTITYDWMVRDFFKFLSEEEKRDHYAAIGSGQWVKVKKPFQHKAKQAYNACIEAIKLKDDSTKASKKWKEVFGQPLPAITVTSSESSSFDNTEEFIENYYPVDIQNNLVINCKVTQNGFRPSWLRTMIAKTIPLLANKSLDFSIEKCDVQEPYIVKWKVLNRGPEAECRNDIRGQILRDSGAKEHHEGTRFKGDHYVECYIIKNNVVVARDRILVPIKTNSE